MKKSAKSVVIVLVLLLEFAWWAWPRVSAHGYAEDPYRLNERMTALSEWSGHPTPETKAAFDKEMELLDEHEHKAMKHGALLLANVVGISWFWKSQIYEPKKAIA
jgi:hypothetical protein